METCLFLHQHYEPGTLCDSLERVSTFAELLVATFPSLCGPAHSKLAQSGLGQVIVEASSAVALVQFNSIHLDLTLFV